MTPGTPSKRLLWMTKLLQPTFAVVVLLALGCGANAPGGLANDAPDGDAPEGCGGGVAVGGTSNADCGALDSSMGQPVDAAATSTGNNGGGGSPHTSDAFPGHAGHAGQGGAGGSSSAGGSGAGGTAGANAARIYRAVVTDEIDRAWAVMEDGGVEGFDLDRRVKWAAPYSTWVGASNFGQAWCVIRDGAIVMQHGCYLGGSGQTNRIWGGLDEVCYDDVMANDSALYCKASSVHRFKTGIVDVAVSFRSVCWVLADGATGCSQLVPTIGDKKAVRVALSGQWVGGAGLIVCQLGNDGSLACRDPRATAEAINGSLKDKTFAGPFQDAVLSRMAQLHVLTVDGKILRYSQTKNMYGEVAEEWRPAKPGAAFTRGSLAGQPVDGVRFGGEIEVMKVSTNHGSDRRTPPCEVCGVTADGRGWGCFVIED
jgi:hypothetical protein